MLVLYFLREFKDNVKTVEFSKLGSHAKTRDYDFTEITSKLENRLARLENSRSAYDQIIELFKSTVIEEKDRLINTVMQRLWESRERESRLRVEQEKKNDISSRRGLSPSGRDIVLVTGYTKNFEITHPNVSRQMNENRQEYCDYHGYTNLVVDLDPYKPLLPNGVPMHWLKLYAIKHAFEHHPEAKWVFWIDSDAIIMNPTIDLAAHVLNKDVLKKKLHYNLPIASVGVRFQGDMYMDESEVDIDNIELIMCHDGFSLNTGSMIVKRSDYTMNKLMDKWLTEEYMYKNYTFPEQDALIDLVLHDDELFHKLGLVPTSVLNAYWEDYWIDPVVYRPGDFLCHFPGKGKYPESLQESWDVMWGRLQESEYYLKMKDKIPTAANRESRSEE